jgi:lipoate-protein ligase A
MIGSKAQLIRFFTSRKMMLKVYQDKPKSAHDNMQIDRELFVQKVSYPWLRLYSFDAFCATSGLFTPLEGLLLEEECRKMNFEVSIRPTGGGLLFHQHDVAFSFYLPLKETESSMQVHELISSLVLSAVSTFLEANSSEPLRLSAREPFCFSSKTAFDLIWGGIKIGGGAERRNRSGILHQGSIFLKSPPWDMIERLLADKKELHVMKKNVRSLEEIVQIPISEKDLKNAIISEFTRMNF